MKFSFLLFIAGAAGALAQVQMPRFTTVDAGGANLPARKIGPNDLIAISVYEAPEFTRTVRVGGDGLIRIPMLKRQIKAEGLMPSELESSIVDALQAEQLIVGAVVTVTVAEYNTRPISVAGAVKQPLTFQVAGPVTLLEALTRAGGLSAEAGPEILVTQAQARRVGAPAALVQRISVKGLIDTADPVLNLQLTGGEEVRIPEVGKIFVIGNVRSPGAYPVQGTTEATVLKALALSGGLLPFASKEAYIFRREEGGSGSKREIAVPLKQLMERKAPDAPLVADDILYVPDAHGRRVGLAALEKILLFGGGVAGSALVYGVMR
jgi:polysaccharide export outer membrane protein